RSPGRRHQAHRRSTNFALALVEKYNKKGKHLGAFDPNTGEMMTDGKGRPKGPIAGRTCG
ncbi:colicin E3/pyocin S6 family cytotoxin, partial [Micromonospora sp. LOL_024]|uniref:colicin E3/pyocin S6 family cytotoxin n=1 Tax=Micromonospora sp. LOL_024 TaxID=3345412 RepID=UPI003A8923FE